MVEIAAVIGLFTLTFWLTLRLPLRNDVLGGTVILSFIALYVTLHVVGLIEIKDRGVAIVTLYLAFGFFGGAVGGALTRGTLGNRPRDRRYREAAFLIGLLVFSASVLLGSIVLLGLGNP